MYRIGICDDGKAICAEIEEMVLAYAGQRNVKLDTAVWYTGEALCRYLEQGEALDILFLDIELLKLTGIEVGDFIRNRLEDRKMQIVYISGKSSYAQALFKTQPLDFLIKPISQKQIDEVLDLGIKLLDKNHRVFRYQYNKSYCYIPFGEIRYFYSEGRKIKIVTGGEEKEFYGKLKDIQAQLPEEFIVIHQSYIVNQAYIANYAYEHVELRDGARLAISKAYRPKVRQHILKAQWGKDGL